MNFPTLYSYCVQHLLVILFSNQFIGGLYFVSHIHLFAVEISTYASHEADT